MSPQPLSKEEKQGRELLKLYKLQRYFSTSTLNGRVPWDEMFFIIGDQIEYLSKEIGGRAKTRLRKEAEKNQFLQKLLKRGEII